MVGGGEIAKELGAQESVLWSGQPGQGLRWRYSDALRVPVSLLFVTVSLVMMAGMLRDGLPIYATLIVVPHALLGLYLLVGHFFADAYLRARTEYFITDQRALIIQPWPWRRVRSVDLGRLHSIHRRSHRDGTTTLVFGKVRRRQAPPAFEWIENGQGVYQLILDVREGDDDD
jgi:hypothetical protein